MTPLAKNRMLIWNMKDKHYKKWRISDNKWMKLTK